MAVLAFIGLAFGPICGVQIADYLLLRRQRLSLTGIYDRGSGTPYHFWHGLNPAAALALAAGCGAYLAILNTPGGRMWWEEASKVGNAEFCTYLSKRLAAESGTLPSWIALLPHFRQTCAQ